MITQARLKELLRYDPRTGAFYRRVSRKMAAGARAGCRNKVNGYWYIGVDYKIYKASRLAWLYVYGRFPADHMDHKNQIRSDDRISNLREATRFQNHANSKTRPSRSGLKGAVWVRGDRYESRIRDGGKHIWLGAFDTPEEAHVAYCSAAKKLHGKFYSPT